MFAGLVDPQLTHYVKRKYGGHMPELKTKITYAEIRNLDQENVFNNWLRSADQWMRVADLESIEMLDESRTSIRYYVGCGPVQSVTVTAPTPPPIPQDY